MAFSSRAKLALRRLGMESTARTVVDNEHVASLLGLTSYSYRRNVKDDRHLNLLLAYVLEETSNCIDVGANHGTFLARMLELAPKGRHLAFEPIPALADHLRRKFPRASTMQVALSDENGSARFSCVVGDEAYSGLRDRHFAGASNVTHFEVPTARLDDVLPDDFIPTLVKIDVEGAEHLVLEGAAVTLRRHRPTVWFEHGAESAGYFGSTSAAIWDLLSGCGYRIFDSDGNGPLSRADFGSHSKMWSFVAH